MKKYQELQYIASLVNSAEELYFLSNVIVVLSIHSIDLIFMSDYCPGLCNRYPFLFAFPLNFIHSLELHLYSLSFNAHFAIFIQSSAMEIPHFLPVVLTCHYCYPLSHFSLSPSFYAVLPGNVVPRNVLSFKINSDPFQMEL